MTFAACSNDEVVTEQQNSAADAIGFRTAITNSRAAAVTLDGLKTSGFWVTTLKAEDHDSPWGKTPIKFAWDNEKFSVATASDEKEWDSYSLEFFASNLDPTTHPFTYPSKGDLDATPTYANFSPARDVADQVDFIYATNKGSRLDFPGTVPLTFNHALAQIEIRAKYAGSGYKVRCKGYKLVYLDGKNAFDFSEPQTTQSQIADNNGTLAKGQWGKVEFSSGETPADCWSGFYGGNGYASGYYADGVFSDADDQDHCILLNNEFQTISGGNNEGTAMLLPQTQAKQGSSSVDSEKGNGFYIALLVQIDKLKADGTTYEPYYPSMNKNKSGDDAQRLAYRGTPKYYGFVSVPVDIKWEAGKKYIYDLDLSSGMGYADPANPGLTNPNDENYDPKNDRDNNSTDGADGGNRETDDNFQAGDSIIGTNITFTYTVHDLVASDQGTIVL
jgi:hypothetical protein